MANSKVDIVIEDHYNFKTHETKHVPTIWIGYQGYPVRYDEEELPKQKAWCKECAQESAEVVAGIWLNAKPAYALKCNKCGNMHHMYVGMFRQRYIGSNIKGGGHINPTRGIHSVRNSMDRKGREIMAAIPKKVEDDMCELFSMSHEEYREMKQRSAERSAQAAKRIEAERAEFRASMRDEKLQRESDERKEMIEKGILKYVKGVGLVNTETGKVVKL